MELTIKENQSADFWGYWKKNYFTYVPPAFITSILLIGQLSFGILDSYVNVIVFHSNLCARRNYFGKVDFRYLEKPGERLYQRHQCGDPDTIESTMALRDNGLAFYPF